MCCGACIYKILVRKASLSPCFRGKVLDVAVDVRVGSADFGRYVSVELSEENRRQFWIPRGLPTALSVLSEVADFFYKCDEVYCPGDEITVRWNDPAIGIEWRIENPSLSVRDASAPPFGRTHSLTYVRAGLMQILLTGATGQVGRALLNPLSRLGTVVSLSRAELDLSVPETIPAILDRLAPDLIINPAAYTAVDQAEDDRELARCVNAISPARMAK